MKISVNNLNKSYYRSGEEINILKNINFTCESSGLYSIIGKSGSGKTTLLNIIAGLDTPNSGDVIYTDFNITSKNEDEKARFRLLNVGLVFQFFNFLPSISLIDNVIIPSLLVGKKKIEANEIAKGLFDKLGLNGKEKRFPNEVSGGELQRASLCRALINSPRYLLADEPTGNLDSKNTSKIIDLLLSVVEERDLVALLVTHDSQVSNLSKKSFSIIDGVV